MKTPKELALLAAHALSDKKGAQIQVLEIGDLTTLADYFVLATGSSNTQINALVDNVEKVLHEEAEEEPLHREGYRGGTWVLLDYGCIVIHVFNLRAFCSENLNWSIIIKNIAIMIIMSVMIPTATCAVILSPLSLFYVHIIS